MRRGHRRSDVAWRRRLVGGAVSGRFKLLVSRRLLVLRCRFHGMALHTRCMMRRLLAARSPATHGVGAQELAAPRTPRYGHCFLTKSLSLSLSLSLSIVRGWALDAEHLAEYLQCRFGCFLTKSLSLSLSLSLSIVRGWAEYLQWRFGCLV